MNSLVSRNSLLDDFFRDFSPGYFIKPLHGDNLPAQIKVDVKGSRGRLRCQRRNSGRQQG